MLAPVVFTPPPHPPQIVELKLSAYAGVPVAVQSHGWEYLLTGNSLLPPKRLRAILRKVEDPQQAVAELLAAYRKAGYFMVAVRASAKPIQSPQKLKKHAEKLKGRVHIESIEGHLTSESLLPGLGGFFHSLQGRSDLTVDQLIRHAVLAETYARRNGRILKPTIAPASQPGGTALKVTAKPMPGFKPFTGVLQAGNYGSRYLSTYLAGTTLSLQPGKGVRLTANGLFGLPMLSKGSKGSTYRTYGLGGSVVTPYGIYGIKAQAIHYRLGKIAAPLYNTGNIRLIGLTGEQMLFANFKSQLWVQEGFHRVINRITVFGGSYTLLEQAYNYLSLGLKYTQGYSMFGKPGGLEFKYAYNQGISPRTGTFATYMVNTAPTPRFGYHTINLGVQQSLPRGFFVQFNLGGQWADATLPQQQQWVLGGPGSLTAYHGGVVAGDSGYSLRVMLQAPAKRLGPISFSPNIFLERGGARYRYIKSPWVSAADYGIGLNIASRWGTTLSMLYARPITHPGLSDQASADQRVGVYFIFQQAF